ncbi:hypothetical protein C1646_816640 [Rhizophagus diaphanus]|nr:hypothetical protein C1646_816640 [Rhizophagus diaphanus] [Rhizophagus sp. MUCL 43196]
MTEIEVIDGYIMNTITKVDKKRLRDVTKSVMEAVIPLKRHYRKLFEQEFSIEDSIFILPKVRSRMESQAYAWYYASYHPYYPSENMISFPWIANDILCDIADRNYRKIESDQRASMELMDLLGYTNSIIRFT